MVWLVLVLTTGSPLHVGNYASISACQAAAKQAVTAYNPQAHPIAFNLICVQAADTGNKPPN